jgi:hypothetical protein
MYLRKIKLPLNYWEKLWILNTPATALKIFPFEKEKNESGFAAFP